MEFQEKARIQIEHWMEHNVNHEAEYERFAEQLDKEGFSGAAEHIRELVRLTKEGTRSLQMALSSLQAE